MTWGKNRAVCNRNEYKCTRFFKVHMQMYSNLLNCCLGFLTGSSKFMWVRINQTLQNEQGMTSSNCAFLTQLNSIKIHGQRYSWPFDRKTDFTVQHGPCTRVRGTSSKTYSKVKVYSKIYQLRPRTNDEGAFFFAISIPCIQKIQKEKITLEYSQHYVKNKNHIDQHLQLSLMS